MQRVARTLCNAARSAAGSQARLRTPVSFLSASSAGAALRIWAHGHHYLHLHSMPLLRCCSWRRQIKPPVCSRSLIPLSCLKCTIRRELSASRRTPCLMRATLCSRRAAWVPRRLAARGPAALKAAVLLVRAASLVALLMSQSDRPIQLPSAAGVRLKIFACPGAPTTSFNLHHSVFSSLFPHRHREARSRYRPHCRTCWSGLRLILCVPSLSARKRRQFRQHIYCGDGPASFRGRRKYDEAPAHTLKTISSHPVFPPVMTFEEAFETFGREGTVAKKLEGTLLEVPVAWLSHQYLLNRARIEDAVVYFADPSSDKARPHASGKSALL